MSDIINLTITETEDVINLTITEENAITIGFYDLALPDARVIQARVDAQAAAVTAVAAQDNVQINATAAVDSAAAAEVSKLAAAASAAEVATDTLEVSANLVLAVAAKDAALVSATNSENSKNNALLAETAAEDAKEVCLAIYALITSGTLILGTDVDGAFRFYAVGGILKLQKKITGVWTDYQEWN